MTDLVTWLRTQLDGDQEPGTIAAAHRAILEMHRDDGLGWCTSCGAMTLDDPRPGPGRDAVRHAARTGHGLRRPARLQPGVGAIGHSPTRTTHPRPRPRRSRRL